MMGNDERATRSVMGNDGVDEIGFGWISLGAIGLGGSVFDGVRLVWVDRSSVVMRSRWWCKIYGGAGAGV